MNWDEFADGDCLYFDGEDITNDVLAEVAKLSWVRGISLNDTQIDDTGLAHLKDMTDLHSLYLRNTGVTDAGLSLLGGLTRMDALSLAYTSLTGPALALLKRMPLLRMLSLEGTAIGDEDLMHLKDLRRLSQLNLAYTKLTGAGLKCLGGPEHVGWLLYLDLRGTKLADESVDFLAQLSGLSQIWLGQTAVTPRGVAALARAQPNLIINHSGMGPIS